MKFTGRISSIIHYSRQRGRILPAKFVFFEQNLSKIRAEFGKISQKLTKMIKTNFRAYICYISKQIYLLSPTGSQLSLLNSGFCCIKRLGVLLPPQPPPDGMLVHRRLHPSVCPGYPNHNSSVLS